VCNRTEAHAGFCYFLIMKGHPNCNQLIESLDSHCHHQLFKHGGWVELTSGQRLNTPGETTEYAYFPTGGVIALMMQQNMKKQMALALVGAEGMVGISHILGVDVESYASTVLTPSEAFRIKVKQLYAIKLKNSTFCRVLDKYVAVMYARFAQAILCHSQHNLQQRMASLLLAYSDCASALEFEMTQALLANLLGVRRSGINNVAINLQQMQILKYSRGHMHIINRASLLKVACQCYANDKDIYTRCFAI
jgi:CRP-like cAMP-binding protein